MTKREIHEKIEDLWKRYRLPDRRAFWKIDIAGRREQESLVYELIKKHRKEFIQEIEDYGLINLRDLSDREQKILRMRFMELKTYEEIGREFDVTRERIRQIEQKALNKLKGDKKKC